jgi:hypothetical protein
MVKMSNKEKKIIKQRCLKIKRNKNENQIRTVHARLREIVRLYLERWKSLSLFE